MKLLFILFITPFFFACKNVSVDYKVSEAEAKSFSKMVAESVADNQPQILNNAINHNAFAQKIGAKLIKANEVRSLLREVNLGTKICEEAKAGSYELVKIFEKNSKRYILFRLSGDNGVNYHEIELCKEKNKVQIADIFVYLTGENFSSTLANLYNTLKKNNSEDNTSFHMGTTLPKIKSLLKEAKYEEALEKYNTLPLSLKKNKTILLYKVLITQNLSDSSYSSAINEYKSSGVENNACLDFVLIDGYILNKKYDEALAAVNSLDSYINKDPYLDFFRYNILTRKGDDAKALPYLEAAAKNMPNDQNIQIELIYSYKESNKKDALKLLVDKYKANKKFDQQTLETILDF